jgi:pimeloyl-ACP methyl ester carboxylesterase
MMQSRVIIFANNEHDNFQIEVIVDGVSSNPCLVLLPSSMRDSEDFNEVAERLAQNGFYVLRPQPRGMGKSTLPQELMTLTTLANDIAMCIEHLRCAPVIVVGHAFGNWIARSLDRIRPSLVKGVVVLAGAAKEFPAGMSEALSKAANIDLPRNERLSALRACLFAPRNDPTSWLEGWHPELGPAYRSAGKIPAKNLWFHVSNAPLLDLQGDCDPWRPKATRNELKDLLGATVTVQVIENASHALIPEQPQAVVQAIVQWAASLKTQSAKSTAAGIS